VSLTFAPSDGVKDIARVAPTVKRIITYVSAYMIASSISGFTTIALHPLLITQDIRGAGTSTISSRRIGTFAGSGLNSINTFGVDPASWTP